MFLCLDLTSLLCMFIGTMPAMHMNIPNKTVKTGDEI